MKPRHGVECAGAHGGESSVKARIEAMNKAFYIFQDIQFHDGVPSEIESVVGKCVFKTDSFRLNGWTVPSYHVFAYSGGAEMKNLKASQWGGVDLWFPDTDPVTAEYIALFCVAYSDSAAGIVHDFAEIASSSLGYANLSGGFGMSGVPPELINAVSMPKSERNMAVCRYVEALRSRLDLELSLRGLY